MILTHQKSRMAPLPGRSTPPQFGLVDFNTQFRPIRGHVVEQKAMVPIQQSPTYHEFRPVNMRGEAIPANRRTLCEIASRILSCISIAAASRTLYVTKDLNLSNVTRTGRGRVPGGYMFQLWTHIVTYVDPHSDAYGKVFPGDRALSVNGMDPEVAWKQHKLGIVDERAHPIVFVRNGNYGFHCILQACNPIRIFPAILQKSLWTPVYL